MPGVDERAGNNCSQVPSLLSAFVDTFVDFTVGGQILGPTLHSGSKSRHHEGSNPAGEDLPTRLPAAERLVAIGDIHGDLAKAKEALRIARVVDEESRWIGGETVVVQVGDLLDRGGEEIQIMYLLEKLKREARKAGGDVHILNGNHEIMNMEGDFRSATTEGTQEFQRWADWYRMGNVLKERCEGLSKPADWFKGIPERIPEFLKARMAALRPGGPLASRFLASHPTVLVVGGTVFVHGGLLPTHVEHGLEKINAETREWMQGKRGFLGPNYLHGRDAVVWVRKYSNQKESSCDCDVLEKALSGVSGARRMVMGHTIQNVLGINAVCTNKAVRVDVGMSEGCGNGVPQVLEIRNDKVLTVLSSSSALKLMDLEDIAAYQRRHQQQQQTPPAGLASLLTKKSSEVKVPV